MTDSLMLQNPISSLFIWELNHESNLPSTLYSYLSPSFDCITLVIRL